MRTTTTTYKVSQELPLTQQLLCSYMITLIETNGTHRHHFKVQEGPLSQTNRAATWANSGKNRPIGLSVLRKAYI